MHQKISILVQFRILYSHTWPLVYGVKLQNLIQPCDLQMNTKMKQILGFLWGFLLFHRHLWSMHAMHKVIFFLTKNCITSLSINSWKLYIALINFPTTEIKWIEHNHIPTFMAVRKKKSQAIEVFSFKIVRRNQRILSELSRKSTHRFCWGELQGSISHVVSVIWSVLSEKNKNSFYISERYETLWQTGTFKTLKLG